MVDGEFFPFRSWLGAASHKNAWNEQGYQCRGIFPIAGRSFALVRVAPPAYDDSAHDDHFGITREYGIGIQGVS